MYKRQITDGLHPAIVDRELFDRVQAIMAGRYIPSKRDGTVKSPLAGLVKCANCGMNLSLIHILPQTAVDGRLRRTASSKPSICPGVIFSHRARSCLLYTSAASRAIRSPGWW